MTTTNNTELTKRPKNKVVKSADNNDEIIANAINNNKNINNNNLDNNLEENKDNTTSFSTSSDVISNNNNSIISTKELSNSELFTQLNEHPLIPQSQKEIVPSTQSIEHHTNSNWIDQLEFFMKALQKKVTEFKLLSDKDVPYFMRNPFIEYGYRLNFSFSLCLQSLFRIHNETANIWTHLLGFVLFFSLSLYTIFFVELEIKHKIVFLVFQITAQKCMLFSTLYHLFGCMSPRAYFKLLRMDYAGISALIGGSMIVMLYEAWYCHRTWKLIYMSFATLVVVLGVFSSLTKAFYLPQNQFLRTLLFIAMAASGVIPTTHLIFHIGVSTPELRLLLIPVALQYITYGVGVLVFAFHIPERWFPGKLDMIGITSHSLMHLFVVIAAFIHYFSSINYISWRMEYGCTTWLHTEISLPDHVYDYMVTAKMLLLNITQNAY